MDTKKCGRCGELKPLDQFYKLIAIKSHGRQSYCITCCRKVHKEWQSQPEVKEHLAEYMRRYRRRVKAAKNDQPV